MLASLVLSPILCYSLHPSKVPLQGSCCGILQLCVISCIACCDLAFCLLAWMTETFELERTDCQPLDMKQSCSLTNNHILVCVKVLLWKWVFACALDLTETWRMASYKCGMQHGLRINCGDFLCISLINDNRCGTLCITICTLLKDTFMFWSGLVFLLNVCA